MKTILYGLLLFPLLSVLACTEEEPPLPRSLASPAGVAAARSCQAEVDGRIIWIAAERCEEGGDIENGVISTLAFVANRERESLMVVDFSATFPQLVDLNFGEPGVTGIPVCEGPSQVEITPDGLYAFVKCDIERALSVVSVPSRAEVLRLERDVVETDIVIGPDVALMASARPVDQELVVERLSLLCDGDEGLFFEGCVPALEQTETARLAVHGTPAFLEVGISGAVFLVYRDLPYVSRFDLTSTEATCLDGAASVPCETARIGLVEECGDGLDNDGDGNVDQADLQCFGPDGAESPEGLRATVTFCTDGIDNDGDGLVDHDDTDCLSVHDRSESGGVLPTECEDGIDNDGDEAVDGDDSECVIEGWFSESPPPCSNGVDDDEDGLSDFPDDPDCLDALWTSEAVPFDSALPECGNGADDDGDGFADRADPGCNDLADESEGAAAPVCNDGVDNDGDGRVDSDDPDCYGPTGDSERALHPVGFGPIALQQSGRYLVVVDPAGHQVLIVDVDLETLIDASGDDFLRSDLGLAFGDNAVAAAPVGYTIEVDRSEGEDLEAGYEQELAFVPASNGRGTAMSLAITNYEVVDGARTEGVDFPMRPQDGDTAVAIVSDVACELTDDYRDVIQEARADETESRIDCEDPDVPRLLTDEEGVAIALIQEERFAIEDGVLTQESVPFDYRLRDETWTLAFEGAIPGSNRDDGLIDAANDGVLVSAGTDFCTHGIQPGDRLIIDAATPSLESEPDACDAFTDVDLEYEIEFVRADALYLALIDDRDDVVAALPTRGCFAEAFSYEIRVAEGTWLVKGSDSGMIHDQTTVSELCVPDRGDARRTGRLETGVPFENVFFSLQVEDSADIVPPIRGFELEFAIENNFASVAVAIGPSPVDTAVATVGSSRRLMVSDAGTNTLFVFDADTLLQIANLF